MGRDGASRWREFGGRGPCECIEEENDMRIKMAKIQLLSSSSVAVSTSQDFDDNATITAFWEEKIKSIKKIGILQNFKKTEIDLLFQSPWHRVCLFCVCILDWKQERLRRRETRVLLSV